MMRKLLLYFTLTAFISTLSLFANANEKVEELSVIKLKVYLKSAGMDVGKLDGLYGKRTDLALKTLLEKNGIVWDGNLDQNDIEIIKRSVKRSPYLYEPSDKNRFIFQLQEQLIIGGFLEQGFTGVFDYQTKKAVEAFIVTNNEPENRFMRDGLPTYSLLQTLELFNRSVSTRINYFVNGKLSKPDSQKTNKKFVSQWKQSSLKPINLENLNKRVFNKVVVDCEGRVAKGDIISAQGFNYGQGANKPRKPRYTLNSRTTTFFKLDKDSFNNCGGKIKDPVSKSWEKRKARAELSFIDQRAQTGYTYVFDAEFMYKRSLASKIVKWQANDRTLIFQIKAEPNPRCGPILGLKINGWKGKTQLEVNSTYIEIDENFSYSRNSGGDIACHGWDTKKLPISFSEDKFHKIRVELSVLDFNHYKINVFINDQHVRTVDYNYKKFPHKVHTAKGFYLNHGLYQMPNEFRSSGQYKITAQYRNVGYYRVKTPDR